EAAREYFGRLRRLAASFLFDGLLVPAQGGQADERQRQRGQEDQDTLPKKAWWLLGKVAGHVRSEAMFNRLTPGRRQKCHGFAKSGPHGLAGPGRPQAGTCLI